ncbi:MAG: ABC transporter permease subunit [Desulfatibacillaceae bacterium]
MTLARPRFSPVTVKRFRRFRNKRLAWWSFWLLVLLYALSLGSELIANRNPLLLRFEGGWYFPIFRYYPESTFVEGGEDTRADYRELASTPRFADESGNWMVFPPVPYDPFESVEPSEIDIPDHVEVAFEPVPRIATVHLAADGTVARATGAGTFFGTDEFSVRGMNFFEHWKTDADLRAAISKRLANEPAPEFSAMATGPGGVEALVTIREYEPRKRPRKIVRLKMEDLETIGDATMSRHVAFARDGSVVRDPSEVLASLSDQQGEQVRALAARRFDGYVDPMRMVIAGDAFTVRFHKAEVRFPYPPTRGHFMGLDDSGRDVFARVLYAMRTSITFGLLLVVFSMAIGSAAGAFQGYYGGLLDITGQRLTEIWQSIPFLYVMILLGSVYGRSFPLLLVVYAVFNWIGISYYMRGEFLRLRKQQFVESAKVLGIPAWKIIFRHILPNALVPVITFFPFQLVGAVGALAALDYLGFGLPPPTPSWGELLSQAQMYRWAWWLITWPSVALFVVMLLGVFIGEGVRNAYDPKQFTRLT